jgi:putative methyltransferase (TIGR04325 family)
MKLDTEEARWYEPLLVRAASVGAFRDWLERRYRARMRDNRDLNLYCGHYASYAQALASIDPDRRAGYDNSESGALYRDRIRRVFPSDYPAMFWLERAFAAGARRVLDVGGHVGIAYYAYQRYVPFPPDVAWQVLDVPAVVAAGREFAQENDPARRLRFIDSFAAADACDLLFASGSLQYLEPTLAELLATMAKPPARVIVNLLPLHASTSFFTVQGIPSATSPYRITREGEFLADMRALGYKVLDRWDNAEKACRVYLRPDLSLDRYTGLCLARE